MEATSPADVNFGCFSEGIYFYKIQGHHEAVIYLEDIYLQDAKYHEDCDLFQPSVKAVK